MLAPQSTGARLQGQCVKWLGDRGFGFVKHGDGPDVFIHFTELPKGVAELQVGQRVEFELRSDQRAGRLLGVRVTLPRVALAPLASHR